MSLSPSRADEVYQGLPITKKEVVDRAMECANRGEYEQAVVSVMSDMLKIGHTFTDIQVLLLNRSYKDADDFRCNLLSFNFIAPVGRT
jgi:hypothetical protein